MPNWCETDLVVSGPSSKLDAFLDRVGETLGEDGEGSLLEAYLPRPQVLESTDFSPGQRLWTPEEIEAETDEGLRLRKVIDNRLFSEHVEKCVIETGYADWWDWSVANWGVKWEDTCFQVVRRSRSVTLGLTTAWNSPEAAIARISKMTGLTFRATWYECGAGFRGSYLYKNGEMVTSTIAPYRGGRGG